MKDGKKLQAIAGNLEIVKPCNTPHPSGMNRAQRRQKTLHQQSRAEILYNLGRIKTNWQNLLTSIEEVVDNRLKMQAAQGDYAPDLEEMPAQVFLVEQLDKIEETFLFIKRSGGCPPKEKLANRVQIHQIELDNFLADVQSKQKEG